MAVKQCKMRSKLASYLDADRYTILMNEHRSEEENDDYDSYPSREQLTCKDCEE